MGAMKSRHIRRAAAAAAMCAVAIWAAVHSRAQGTPYDILIRSGHVLDGTANPGFGAESGIQSGRIVAVGALPQATATRVIDARDLIVAPGFIDLHTH